MPVQLPLEFNWQVPIYAFNNYIATPNQLVYQSLLQFLQGNDGHCLYLWGETGTGKTHLLQAACKHMAQQEASPVYVPLNEFSQFGPEALEGLEELELVCVDDIHLIAGQAHWEEAFFALFNRIRESDSFLLISGNAMPKALGLGLPDLASRLAWENVFKLDPLTENDKIRVLQTYAEGLGIDLPENIGEYLIQHCPKDLKALIHWLEHLDYVSLSNKRRLTLPFVREVLKQELTEEK